MSDPRIIDFSKSSPFLPDTFITVEPKRVIYAAGDAFGGFNKTNYSQTNIEAFVKLGFNIFCVAPMDINNENLIYLKEHSELNIVVCILTTDNKKDYSLLQTLFNNSVSEIDTDDARFYPDSKTCFEILKQGGICSRVPRKFIFGQSKNTLRREPFYPFDSGWGEPNFTIIGHEDNRFNLSKHGMKYVFETDFSPFRNIQEARNQEYVEHLRMENAQRWNINSRNRPRGPLYRKGGSRKKSRKSRKIKNKH
jgi:hypothetical protein